MTDRYGRTITDHGNGLFSVEGIELVASDIDAAIATFNLMAPFDWIEPFTSDDSEMPAAL